MADLSVWTGRAVFGLVAALLLTLSALPLGGAGMAPTADDGDALAVVLSRLPAPDILLLAAFAWVVRRPDRAPALLVAAALLLRDLLTGAPPGLGAALGLIATERMRGRRFEPGAQGFLSEWVRVGGLLLVVALAEMVILSALLVPGPPAGGVVLRVILGVVLYPVVVGALRILAGLRAPGPEEGGT
ncbi:MAG: hypothetical protein ACU0BS_08810 [Hasllibacter sp.]